MISWLLSIDPGVEAAWALWAIHGRWGLLERIGRARQRIKGGYKAPGVLECKRLLDEFSVSKGIDWSSAEVVVEGQFFLDFKQAAAAGYQSGSWNSIGKLIEARCAWVDAALVCGAQVEIADPKHWIPAMTRGAKGDDSKARIKAMVAARSRGRVEAIEDENDAILLGCWKLEEMRIVPRIVEAA